MAVGLGEPVYIRVVFQPFLRFYIYKAAEIGSWEAGMFQPFLRFYLVVLRPDCTFEEYVAFQPFLRFYDGKM